MDGANYTVNPEASGKHNNPIWIVIAALIARRPRGAQEKGEEKATLLKKKKKKSKDEKVTRRAGAKKTRVRAEEGKGALTKQIRISAAQERLNSPTLRDKKESQRVGLVGDADSLISCDEKTRQLCHTVARALYLKHQPRS